MTHDEVMAALRALLKRPVAYHRAFAKIGGGATAGLMLSQAWYWSGKTDSDGWFYKSQEEWEEETGLTRTEQETARRNLREKGLIEEKRAGMPARLYFRVNAETLFRLLAENPQSRMQETRNQERGKAADKNAANLQPFNKDAETTSETTTESPTPRAREALKTYTTLFELIRREDCQLINHYHTLIVALANEKEFDPKLWRDVCEQSIGNGTTNVGTTVRMYREQAEWKAERASRRGPPAKPVESAAEKSRRLEEEMKRAKSRPTA